MDTKLFCSGKYVLKKCVYHAFAAKVFSEVEAKEVIERVGRLVKNIDVCPFAVRLMITTTLEEQQEKEQKCDGGGDEVEETEGKQLNSEGASPVQQKQLFRKEEVFCEDNGDLGIGGLLSELLFNEGTENMILLVTRVVKGTFPPEMINQTKFAVIKEAALAATRALVEYLNEEMEKAMRVEQQRLRLIEEARTLINAQVAENESDIREIDKKLEDLELQHDNLSSVCAEHESTKVSFEKLLNEIESAADERSKLELDMEQAEDLDAQLEENRKDNYSGKNKSSKSIEDLKARYFKAKEHLTQLRTEKKQKEPEYKDLIKKFKTLDIVALEIRKLKDANIKCLEKRIELEKQKERLESNDVGTVSYNDSVIS